MSLSTDHLICYIIFILCIGLITYCYCYNKYNENFETNPDIIPDTNTMIMFNDSEISNISTKNSINKQLPSINSLFNKYSILNPAININNNGVLCDDITSNTCTPLDNSNTSFPQCISNNIMTSCSN